MASGTGTSAGGAMAPGGAGSGSSGSPQLNQLLQQYQVPTPDIAQAYMRSFNRGGPIDVPSFQELYGSYQNVAARNAAQAGANLTESFGSQGARYGSDIMRGQGRLQQNLAQDLNLQSGNLLQNLRGQQFNEANQLSGMQYGIEEAGMTRLFQDFLRRSSPPPLFGAGLNFNPPQPATGIY